MRILRYLTQLFGRPAVDPATAALYGACVARSRAEEFYRLLTVPDTVDGRFDLLVLHVFLVMRRLGAAGARQRLFDLMFADMDQNLREMGVGDMSVGKRIRPMISAFYGRAQAYEKALAEGEAALDRALARNLYGKTAAAPEAVRRMADYVRRSAAALDRQPVDDLLAGRVEFASPISA